MSFFTLFLFILQIVVSVLLIVVVLFQSSSEDSLSGIGAGAGKPTLLSHKTSVDLITKTTIVLGVILMVNSFLLTSISTREYRKSQNIIKDYIKENKNEIIKDNLEIKNTPKNDTNNINNNKK